jgi:radical SAM/Cys-rich protein
MTRDTFEACLRVLEKTSIQKVDITGGAPEMNPHFRWFVEECRKLGRHVMVRCNLTIISSGARYADLPTFFAQNQVEVISSLPHYTPGWTDRQRGDHVFEKSIAALQSLNAVGYSRDAGLQLNLVTNPVGAFLPGGQGELEADFKRELSSRHGVTFNHLYTITNMPISRFLEALRKAGKLEEYMEKLVQSFNPAAALGVMCRNTLSVGWDGGLFDCDFNQMLEMPLGAGCRTIWDIESLEGLTDKPIKFDNHCYGCTAGAGSSCGGSLI